MRRHAVIYLTLAYMVVLAAVSASMSSGHETPHSMFHAVYENWLTVNGGSCCNDNDCHGASAWRFGVQGYQVYFDGDWHDVPREAVRPYASPDGNAHVCVFNGRILCFVPGSGA